MCPTSDGGYIIVGGTLSSDGDVKVNRGAEDAWVVKLNSYGFIEWQRTYGGSGLDEFSAVVECKDGGYVVAGETSSNDGDVVGHHPSTGQSVYFAEDTLDGWVLKLSKLGDIEWQRCLGGNRRDELVSLSQTTDGGYILAGGSESTSEDWYNHGDRDCYVVKLDSNGHTNWQKQYGGTSLDFARSIIQTRDGGFIFTGTALSADGEVIGNHTTAKPGLTTADLWVVRLDAFGTLLWNKCYGGSDAEQGNSILQTADGGFLVTGTAQSSNGDVLGHHPFASSADANDAWVIRIDSLGAIIWQKCLGGSSGDLSYSAIEDSVGNFILGCSTASIDGDITSKHGGVDTTDVWIVKLNPSGNIIWERCYGGTNFEGGSPFVMVAHDGSLMFVAQTLSTDGDVQGTHGFGNHGAGDMWVVDLAPEGSGVANTTLSNDLAYPFPNPTSNVVHMEMSHSQTVHDVAFFTILGTPCYPKYQIDGTTLTVDAQSLSAGIYIMRASYPDFEGKHMNKDIRRFVVSK